MDSAFWGEFFGTMVFLAFGIACSAGMNLKYSLTKGKSFLFVGLTWGLAITMGVYTAMSFGSVGNLDPAVTLAFAMYGMVPWSQVPAYMIGQFLGAFVGALIAVVAYLPHFYKTTEEEGNDIGVFATGPKIKTHQWFYIISEVVATFFLCFILMNLGNSFAKGLQPIVAGLLIGILIQAFGGQTGAAMNPARDLAPRILHWMLPFAKGDSNWGYAWIPVVGPFIGGALAGGLQCLFKFALG
jgi:glycerol uptake facilitator protein